VPRVVSLIASATEIVCALGGENWLVGCSHECDYPESVKRLPICTMPRFDVEGTSRDLPVLAEKAEWLGLKAVRTGRVFLTDGNQFFNRPGPRLVESLEILAELLHPSTFAFGHEGTGWQRP
jgi:ABC-type Fe3+-hydroxamate transport system substrate-binding protein